MLNLRIVLDKYPCDAYFSSKIPPLLTLKRGGLYLIMPITYAQRKRWQARYPDKYKAEKKRYRQKKRKKVDIWLQTLKATLTCSCGENDPICLDAHHKDPAYKNGSISSFKSIARLQQELEKCVWLCSNCHRKGHAGRPRPEHKEFFIYLNPDNQPFRSVNPAVPVQERSLLPRTETPVIQCVLDQRT